MSPRCWAGFNTSATTLAALTAMILAIIAWSLRPSFPANDPVSVNASCAPERTLDTACVPLATEATGCTLGYRLADYGVCAPPAYAPTGTPCESACYVPGATTTACDNVTGACVGDPSESRGYCDNSTDLNATIPIADYWLTVEPNPDNDYPVIWKVIYNCYLNTVRLIILDMTWTTNPGNTGEFVGAMLDCREYLENDFASVRGHCVTTEEHWLDPAVTPIEHYVNNTNQEQQFRLCIFTYASGALNLSAVPPTKRAVGLPADLPPELFAKRR
jgi:hypothetical protein